MENILKRTAQWAGFWLLIFILFQACNKDEKTTPESCLNIEKVNVADSNLQDKIKPLLVKVTNEAGKEQSGVMVSWGVETGNGTITASSVTGSDGTASAEWTLGGSGENEIAHASLNNGSSCKLNDQVSFTAFVELVSKDLCTQHEITKDTTLADVLLGNGIDYTISCDIIVKGTAVLTIAPGVIIQFEGAASGIFTTENAALNAVGTVENPILFIGKTTSAGSWQGIYFGSNNPLNVLDHVNIFHAGATASAITGEKGAVQLNHGSDSRAVINNCTIRDNEGYGVYVSIGSNLTEFKSNLITANTLSPVAIPFTQLEQLDSTTIYTGGNGNDYIKVIAEDMLDNTMTIKKLSIPYHFTGNKIYITRALTINQGTVLEFETGTGLKLGTQAADQLDRTGSIQANGTASDSIIFKGVVPGQGSWLGIGINSSSPANSFLYCTISGGGSSQMYNAGGKGNIVLTNEGTTAVIKNCTIKNSLGWGIHKGFQQTSYIISITASDNVFSNNALGDVSTDFTVE